MMKISMVDCVAAMIMIPVVFIISFGHLESTYVDSMGNPFCSDIVEKLKYLLIGIAICNKRYMQL